MPTQNTPHHLMRKEVQKSLRSLDTHNLSKRRFILDKGAYIINKYYMFLDSLNLYTNTHFEL